MVLHLSPAQRGGTRRAVIVAITYRGQNVQLNGPPNDAKLVYEYLTTSCEFDPKFIVICTDTDMDLPGAGCLPATKEYIMLALKLLTQSAESGDSLWLSYSGHGGKKWDVSGDEEDGFDNTILPSDFKKSGHIVDDDLHTMLHDIPQGARLTALFDCCLSATVLDLPYQYRYSGNDIHVKDCSTNLPTSKLKVVRALASGTVTGLVHGVTEGRKKKGFRGALFGGMKGAIKGMEPDYENLLGATKYLLTSKGQITEPLNKKQITAEVFCFTGSKDYLPSRKMFSEENGLICGRVTASFLAAMQASNSSPSPSYKDILQFLKKDFHSVTFMSPQLSSSHLFSLDNTFAL